MGITLGLNILPMVFCAALIKSNRRERPMVMGVGFFGGCAVVGLGWVKVRKLRCIP